MPEAYAQTHPDHPGDSRHWELFTIQTFTLKRGVPRPLTSNVKTAAMDHETFFEIATDTKHVPYPWQGRLANGDGYEASTPSTHTGTPCQSRRIDIPTGLGKTAGPTKLDLAVMRMGASSGKNSWLSRMLALRDDPELGPLRLSLLETLLRAADGRASASAQGK